MALFTVAEARAFGKGELKESGAFSVSDATITAFEVAIRREFELIIGVALSATASIEYYDGDGSDELRLNHHNPRRESSPRPLTVSGISIVDEDGVETPFTAGELAAVIKYPEKIALRQDVFEEGRQNVKVTYTHGYVTAPDDIKQAAMRVMLLQPPDGLVPGSAPDDAYEGSEGGVKWSRVKDPERGRWYGNENIDGTLRKHRSVEARALLA
jgi:hypothetical protein